MSESTGRDKAHEEFVRPGPLPAGANLADAEARLLKALEQELGVPLAEAPKPQLKLVRPNRLKPLLAFAAVGLATAGLVWSLGSLKWLTYIPREKGSRTARRAFVHCLAPASSPGVSQSPLSCTT